MRSQHRLHIVWTAALLLLVGAITFRDFLFGDLVLLYKDIGSDSITFYYPYLVLFSRYIRDEGFPLWSFAVGMGQTLFPDVGVLLFNPIAWFPKSAIAYLMVYQHLLLVLVAGLFFFKFFTLRGLNLCASLLATLLLSYSAYMTMGSCWTVCADEVVCIAFTLFALETALVRGRWVYLPLAVSLFGLISAFHLCLAAIFITAYYLARLFAIAGRDSLKLWRETLQLGAVAFLGAGLTAVVWGESLIQILNSSRAGAGSYVAKLSSFGLFAMESRLHYATAILRSYANDMMGAGDHFHGWYNYFEAPMSYCGLISLVMVPQLFLSGNVRTKIIAGFFLGAIGLATIFPWFRYLFYLFQGDYYRAFSLFSVIGLVIIAATAFTRYLETRRLNIPLLVSTVSVLVAVLYLPRRNMQEFTNHSLQKWAALLLITYAALLSLGKILRRERACGWLILAFTAAELCHFNWLTVSGRRPIVTKTELHERIGFNDYTIDALRAINANEKPFFRVTKTYFSGSSRDSGLNDSFVFDYFGTMSYVSFQNIYYINFLIAAGALPEHPTENETRWSKGLLGHPVLSTFAGEKYVLTSEAVPPASHVGYEEAGEYGNIYVYRNTSSLPFGLFFPNAIDKAAFAQFTPEAKESLLLHKAVLDQGAPPADVNELIQHVQTVAIPHLVEVHRGRAFQIDSFRQSHITGTILCKTDGYLVFQMAFDPGWRVTVDGTRTQPMVIDGGLLGAHLAAGEHQITLRYLPPSLYVGSAVSLLSLIVLGFAAWRWPYYRISAAPK